MRGGKEDINWFERNCLCDELCSKYGDCCIDSPYFRAAEQRRGAASYSCISLKQYGGVYMITTCPPKWDSMPIRSKCENMNYSDPLTTLPATSIRTNKTYRNLYCALCHNDLENSTLDVWKPRLECPTLLQIGTSQRSEEEMLQLLVWNAEKEQWGIHADDWHACFVDPVLPESSHDIIRRCPENTVHTCAIDWTNADVRHRCEAYTSLVYNGAIPYRNPHCAMCNNIPLQNLGCSKVSHRLFYHKEFSPTAFAVLFDLSGLGAVGKVKPCLDDQLYDPFFKKCRDVLCPRDEATNDCIVQNSDFFDQFFPNAVNETYDGSVRHLLCPRFLLSPDEYLSTGDDNNTIFIPAYDKYFLESEYLLNEDDSVEICVGTLGTRLVNKFGQYMGYVTAIGLGVSIIFLVLHLIAFSMVPDLQNLSGKNLASLCLTLLIANCSFIAGQSVKTATRSCLVLGVITYYGYLASFFWMLTMAFDIWRTLKIATFELRVSSGKQWKKFAFYSLWSWLMPLAIAIAAVSVDVSPSASVDVHIRPQFGVHSCWFGHKYALLLFFAIPLAIIMILNIFFFSSSAHMIFSTTSTTRYTASGSTQRDFRLYLRLALVMGLTWITGLFGGYLDVDALWYAFIALNTLQGLLIFLAFTCNDKVVRSVRERLCSRWSYDHDIGEGKDRRPPSFSWSGGSSNSTNKSNLGSSSDEGLKKSKMNYDSAPRSKAFDDRLNVDYAIRNDRSYDSPFDSINSKNKNFDLNSKLRFGDNYRGKNYNIFPKINYSSHPQLDADMNHHKVNPTYGSTKKVSKNASYDRRHLDDTLY